MVNLAENDSPPNVRLSTVPHTPLIDGQKCVAKAVASYSPSIRVLKFNCEPNKGNILAIMRRQCDAERTAHEGREPSRLLLPHSLMQPQTILRH